MTTGSPRQQTPAPQTTIQTNQNLRGIFIIFPYNTQFGFKTTGSFTRTVFFNMLITPFKMSLYKVKLNAKFN